MLGVIEVAASHPNTGYKKQKQNYLNDVNVRNH